MRHPLRLRKLGRTNDPEPRPAKVRHERETSGEIIHMELKALPRFAKPGHRMNGRHTGMARISAADREGLNIAIHDHSRVNFVSRMPDQIL